MPRAGFRQPTKNVNQAYRKMQIFTANILKFLKYFLLLIIYGVI